METPQVLLKNWAPCLWLYGLMILIIGPIIVPAAIFHNIAAIDFRSSAMRALSNTCIKSLLGIILLCVFTLRPCAALVRNVSVLKNLAAIEKGIEDASKENKETKDSKDRPAPEYEALPIASQPVIHFYQCAARLLPLHDVPGCSGPVLKIPTPPPDHVSSL